MYQLRTNGLLKTRFWCFSINVDVVNSPESLVPWKNFERTEISTKNNVEFHQWTCGFSSTGMGTCINRRCVPEKNRDLFSLATELSQLVFWSNSNPLAHSNPLTDSSDKRENHGWNNEIKLWIIQFIFYHQSSNHLWYLWSNYGCIDYT